MSGVNGRGAPVEDAGQDLPEGWASAPLCEVADSRKGKKPNTLDTKPAPGTLPYIDIEAFETASIRRYADPGSSVIVGSGSLLVVWDGARSGLVGRAPCRGALGSTLAAIDPAPGLSSEYLARFLQSQFSLLNTQHRGTGIPHVDPDLFWHLNLPLAPNAEQARIFDAIDRASARVAATRERLAKVPAILNRFRQSVLGAACSGRLTAKWRGANLSKADGQALAQEIRASLPSERHATQTPTVDFAVPEEWGCLTISELLRPPGGLSYGILKPGAPDPKGVPMVRVLDLGERALSGTEIVRVSPALAAEYKRTRIEMGDILLAVMATVGRAVVAPRALVGANVNRALAVIKLTPSVLPEFVCWVIRSPFFQRKFQSEKLGSAQARINIGDLREFPIPIPSRDEQIEILRRVDALFKIADTIEKRVSAASARSDKLTQAILAKAFRGELVATEAELARAEGRDYEPANLLLDRIRRERAAVEPKPHGSGPKVPLAKPISAATKRPPKCRLSRA